MAEIMIELTREEALDILKTFSLLEGFLIGLQNNSVQYIQEEFTYPVELLSRKLLVSYDK
jgi:hypothetical protein